MFQFPRFPLPALCVQAGVTPHDGCWVSPFGHPRIAVWSATPRGFSQPPTSFIGIRRQGIHRWHFVAWRTTFVLTSVIFGSWLDALVGPEGPLNTLSKDCSCSLCSSQGSGLDRELVNPETGERSVRRRRALGKRDRNKSRRWKFRRRGNCNLRTGDWNLRRPAKPVHQLGVAAFSTSGLGPGARGLVPRIAARTP